MRSFVPETLEPTEVRTAPPPFGELHGTVTSDAERLARTELRRQIATLERELGELFASSFPRQGIEWGIGSVGGPRVLALGDLERVRDALAARLADVRAELSARVDVEEANRGMLERMIAAPERHRWVIVSNDDIGEPGCRHWHARPRWGILGMLFGWWRIRLSSGCPLAEGLRPPATPATAMAKKRRKPRPRQAPAPQPASAPKTAAGAAIKPRPRRPIGDERPPAPWGSFPLVELAVAVALVMLVAGFIVGGSRGGVLLVTGFALGSLAELELSIREHFAGYRSHTTLLAATVGVATMLAVFYLADLSAPVSIAIAVPVAATAAWLLVRRFRSRAGRAVKLR